MNNTNISSYAAILEVAKLGSFSKAAEKLGYTQSGMTYIIKNLETQIGFPLLERGFYGARLTPKGEIVKPLIEQLVRSADALHETVLNLSSTGYEVLRIGSFSSMTQHWLPAIVKQYTTDFPNVRVEFQTGSVSDLYSGLAKKRYDMLFVSHSDSFSGEWIPLWEDMLMAVLPTDMETSHQNHFNITDFENRRFLMPGFGFDVDITRIFHKYTVKPDIISTSLDDPFIMLMVEHGLGVSMLSKLILFNTNANIKALPLYPITHRQLGIAMHKDREKSSYIRNFIEYSQEFAKTFKVN